MAHTEPGGVHQKRVLKQMHGNTEAKFEERYRGFTQKISNFYSAHELSNRMQKFQNAKKIIPKLIPKSNSTAMKLFLIPALVLFIVSITMG